MLHMTRSLSGSLAQVPWRCGGCCDPHIRKLCLFTAPETWKVASSENMMFVRKLGPLQNRSSMSQAKSCLRGLSSGFSSCSHRDPTAFREPYAQLLVASAVPVTPEELTSLGLQMNAIWTFSTFSSGTRCRPPLCHFRTRPVSRNLLCHALTLFASGAAFWKTRRNSLCTLTMDLNSENHTTRAFSWADAVFAWNSAPTVAQEVA
jgi:hypothetical protein